jgi:hypothetical protein
MNFRIYLNTLYIFEKSNVNANEYYILAYEIDHLSIANSGNDKLHNFLGLYR